MTSYRESRPTRPYYRSSYVVVSRQTQGGPIADLDDPELRRLQIGVQMIGDDFANTPPGHALSRRGIIGNVVGFPVYGNYAEASPAARIVRASRRATSTWHWSGARSLAISRRVRALRLP